MASQLVVYDLRDFQGALVVKNPAANAGITRDMGLIPGSGSSSGVGNGNQLQYSCLENSMDRGAWRAAIHEVAKNRTLLDVCARARTHTHTHTHTCIHNKH